MENTEYNDYMMPDITYMMQGFADIPRYNLWVENAPVPL